VLWLWYGRSFVERLTLDSKDRRKSKVQNEKSNTKVMVAAWSDSKSSTSESREEYMANILSNG